MSHATEIIPIRVVVAPANTESNPALTSFRPTARGRVMGIIWQFPIGSDGRVAAVVEDREGQIAPVNGEEIRFGGGPPLPMMGLGIPIGGTDPAVRVRAWVDAGATQSTTLDIFLIVEPYEVA